MEMLKFTFWVLAQLGGLNMKIMQMGFRPCTT